MVEEIISVDLGGTHLRVGIVKHGKIFDLTVIETPKSKEKLLKVLLEEIKKRVDSKIKYVGIACAGVIENNIIKICPNLPLKNVNLKKYIEVKLNVKVKIENDANCAAIAEAKLGVRKKNFIVLTLGTGVGGGIIVNGNLYNGKGCGGELGHIIINNGKDFEYNLVRAKPNVEKMSEVVGVGISSLISVFDPEVIVISGGMTKFGNKFLSKIKEKTKKYMFLHRMPKIMFSEIDNPGVVGASLLWG